MTAMHFSDPENPRAASPWAVLASFLLLFVAGCNSGLSREHAAVFKPIADAIQQAQSMSLHEAVPHSLRKGFKPGDKPPQPDMIELGEHLFYAKPLTPTPDTVEALRRLCAAEDTYRRYEQLKCMFNADFCLEWKEGDRAYRVIICFGCEEVWVQGPGNAVLLALQPEAADQLARLLEPLRVHHPEAARKNVPP